MDLLIPSVYYTHPMIYVAWEGYAIEQYYRTKSRMGSKADVVDMNTLLQIQLILLRIRGDQVSYSIIDWTLYAYLLKLI